MKKKALFLFISLLAVASCNNNSSSFSSSNDTPGFYTVKWVNDDGTVLEIDEKVKEGTLPTYDGATPNKDSGGNYSYVFNGWDKRIHLARNDETYIATYKKVGKPVSVSWINDDGSLLLKEDNEYGKLPHYSKDIPSNSDDSSYVFVGWSSELKIVEDEVTYRAIYEQVNDVEAFSFSLDNKVISLWGIDTEYINYSFNYDDRYFLADSFQRNDNLALLSLGAAGFNSDINTISNYFSSIHFNDVISSPSYLTKGYDQIAYTFANKMIKDEVVVAISIRGFEYGNEMFANFLIGESGEHNSFKKMANIIYDDLISYLDEYIDSNHVKLWINGYSRAGAIANILSKTIGEKIDNHKINNIAKKDIYSYCFEPPLAGEVINQKDYQFIHNYVNSYDIVTLIPPQEYGFTLYGEKIDIYDINVKELLLNLDPSFPFGEYKPYKHDYGNQKIVEDINGEKDMRLFILKFLDLLLREDLSTKYPDLSTTSNFHKFFESSALYLAELFMSMDRDDLFALYKKISIDPSFYLLLLIGEDTSLFVNEVLKLFDECEIEYDKDIFAAVLTNIHLLFFHYIDSYSSQSELSIEDGIATLFKNLFTIIGMHSFEVSYVLLNNILLN